MLTCPCGSGTPLPLCCGRYLDAGQSPATAELLMRSRYCAYALGRAAYLEASWHPSTRPTVELDDRAQWLGLTVLSHEQQDATHATVEFVARYRERGAMKKLHERSRFERVNGRWLYLDGDLRD
jgi:SEC-C motif-containing protein